MSNNLTDYVANYKVSAIKDECIEAFKNSNVDLWKLIKKAHEMTLEDAALKRKNYKQKNYMAEVMYGNMIGLLYDNYPLMMFEDGTGCPYLKLAKNIRVYFKKLNEKYLPHNIVTESVKARRGQELMLDDEKIHVLYAGYLLLENNWMQLQGIYASYINEYYPRENEWAIDLLDFVRSDSAIVTLETSNEDEQLVTVPNIEKKEEKQG